MAVFLGLLEPGDTVMGMSLDHGGRNAEHAKAIDKAIFPGSGRLLSRPQGMVEADMTTIADFIVASLKNSDDGQGRLTIRAEVADFCREMSARVSKEVATRWRR